MQDQREEKIPFYIVPTPIGNLEDITQRALRVLSEVDAILCEDTRHTGKLLKHFHIENKLMSYHAHSSQEKENAILEQIGKGMQYAMVSDAGTPTISDPGAKLIHRIHEVYGNQVDIIPLPGATALIPAIAASGFKGNQFTFYGFFPQKKGRKKLLEEIFSSSRIAVFYESPHRIEKLLHMIQEYFPQEYEEKNIFVARELTKKFEEKIRGTVREVHQYFLDYPEKVRGEFVIVIDA